MAEPMSRGEADAWLRSANELSRRHLWAIPRLAESVVALHNEVERLSADANFRRASGVAHAEMPPRNAGDCPTMLDGRHWCDKLHHDTLPVTHHCPCGLLWQMGRP